MENTLSNALLLMLVGMISVTMVLTIVVIGGSLLIKVVNKFHVPDVVPNDGIKNNKTNDTIDKNILAVIAAVVTHTTNGKGKVDEVTKDL